MNYPDHIYGNFRIIEDVIYGETFYAVEQEVKKFSFLKFKTKSVWVKCKLDTFLGISAIREYGFTWHSDRKRCEDAIEKYQEDAEWNFRFEVRK